MAIRIFRTWLGPGETEIPGDRCVIGRHQINPNKLINNLPLFVVDGTVICYNHVVEILEVFDSIEGTPTISARMMMKHHNERDAREAKAAKISQMRRSTSAAPGFVYYIRIDQHIKIGFATDISRRMRAYPPSALLLAAHPGTKETEKQMHQDFRAYLDRGREWFTQGKSLMAHIDKVLEQFGDPKLLAYEYTKAKRAG